MCGCVRVQWTDYRELCNICAKHMLVRSGEGGGGERRVDYPRCLVYSYEVGEWECLSNGMFLSLAGLLADWCSP